eukprot:3230546-Amphidinium_carterae.1
MEHIQKAAVVAKATKGTQQKTEDCSRHKNSPTLFPVHLAPLSTLCMLQLRSCPGLATPWSCTIIARSFHTSLLVSACSAYQSSSSASRCQPFHR